VSAIEYSDDTDAFYSDIHVLEVQVSAGDVEAFELAIRLAEQSEGGDLRDLKVVASRAIRSHPDLLLTQFESEPQFANLLASILVTVGEEYIDRPLARKYELQARRDALAGVDRDSENAELTRLLAILDEAINGLDWPEAAPRLVIHSTAGTDPLQPVEATQIDLQASSQAD
jgi:hypothetical protein